MSDIKKKRKKIVACLKALKARMKPVVVHLFNQQDMHDQHF